MKKLNYEGVVGIIYDMGAGSFVDTILDDNHIELTLRRITHDYLRDYGIDKGLMMKEIKHNKIAFFDHIRAEIGKMSRH